MLELVQQLAVPAAVMRSAAHGALSLPPAEMLEILVHLAGTKMWSEQAQLTLSGWRDADLLAVLGEPSAPASVIQYFLEARNARPALLPVLVAHPGAGDGTLAQLAEEASTSTINALLSCSRVQHSEPLLRMLAQNPCVGGAAAMQIAELLQHAEGPSATTPATGADDPAVADFVAKNAPEIAAAEGAPFSIVEPTPDEHHELAHHSNSVAGARVTVLQKIAKMTVSERVQVAMRGSRDERFILIRDLVRVVAVAVLESPKVTESEMEAFASMRNVSEDVLRSITRNRRFMKHYAVVRSLVNNPRMPTDVGIGLLPHLLTLDLRHLMRNRNVSELIQKTALKLYRQKSERGPQ
jgi:hypothetical protein